jgi:hypothetical protein
MCRFLLSATSYKPLRPTPAMALPRCAVYDAKRRKSTKHRTQRGAGEGESPGEQKKTAAKGKHRSTCNTASGQRTAEKAGGRSLEIRKTKGYKSQSGFNQQRGSGVAAESQGDLDALPSVLL